MRKLILLLLFIPIQAQQYQLDIYGLQEGNRDGHYNLKGQQQENMGTIDCFSFITGITPSGAANSFYLYPSECEEILSYLSLWINEEDYGCVFLDYENMQWDMEKACNE